MIVNPLDDFEIVQGRRVGNTARLVDRIVQLLFAGNEVYVLDHFEKGKIYNANKSLRDRIMRRLRLEYNIPTSSISVTLADDNHCYIMSIKGKEIV